ncbi:hypothetical protein [Spirosoma flavum]|uniref:SLATT domain-containing protein n=1 Tax=Spirosoma flavum TaxID=2048557 RepID=A0ABW6AS63_9BACT
MEKKTNQVTNNLKLIEGTQDSILIISIIKPNIYTEIINRQYKSAKLLKNYYYELAVIYNNNYYKFSACFVVFSALLAVIVFLIAQKGWATSDAIIKVLFLLVSTTASFYYVMPLVFNNKENLQKNIDKIKIFQGLQSDILTFSSSIDKASQKKIDSMIVNINSRIKDNYDFPITIDPTKADIIPSSVLKTIK